MAEVSRWIENQHRPVTLIGSSLGGHYATWLAERHDLRAVLINPAAVDRMDLHKFIGPQTHYHSGACFEFTAAHAAQLMAQVRRPTPSRYWLLLETGDAVLDYHAAQSFWLGCRQSVFEGGDHSFTRFPELLPQLIEFAGL
jgi:uncharacterized protein